MPREILVYGQKTFKITVPDDAKLTFGPFSPPRPNSNFGSEERKGTLRVYKGSKENMIACFTHVESFRDLSMDYSEQVVVEEGASIWKSDARGYEREDRVKSSREWVDGEETLALPQKTSSSKKGKK